MTKSRIYRLIVSRHVPWLYRLIARGAKVPKEWKLVVKVNNRFVYNEGELVAPHIHCRRYDYKVDEPLHAMAKTLLLSEISQPFKDILNRGTDDMIEPVLIPITKAHEKGVLCELT